MKKKYFVYILALFFLSIDLFSKSIIVSNGRLMYRLTVIKNFFYINYVKNTGAAFSILKGYTYIFIILAIIASFYICKFCISDDNKNIEIFGYSLLLSGIIGNLCDRLFRGYVIDFLSFKIFNYYFPIFNFADIFIVVGAILIIIDLIWGKRNEVRSKK